MDLQQAIQTWSVAGEHVIVMMDCNQDVRSNRLQAFAEACNMREIILDRHGQEAPWTYRSGKRPIDGIFATRSVQCVQAGYTGFQDGV